MDKLTEVGTKRLLHALQERMEAESNRHHKVMAKLWAKHIAIRDRCEHKWTYVPDASGNNDSLYVPNLSQRRFETAKGEMMETPKAICAHCKHCHRTSQEPIWYNFFCAHPATGNAEKIDPVTGQEAYVGDGKYKYCRDINANGDCSLYEVQASAMRLALERAKATLGSIAPKEVIKALDEALKR